MTDLLLRTSGQADGPDRSGLTPAQQQAINHALLTIVASSEQSRAAQGVVRAARALKKAQDDHLRATEVCDQEAAAVAAEMAREAEAALLRAVVRMPTQESRPKQQRQSLSKRGWDAMVLG